MPLSGLMATCARAFDAWGGAGGLVDQEFVAGVTRGIVRCYLVDGRVVGFARQYPEGAVPDGLLSVAVGAGPSAHEVMGLPSPKTMYAPAEPAFAPLRRRLETEWVPGLVATTGLGDSGLPALWDIDLLIADTREADVAGEPRFVLCEINASCVLPFPPEAPDQVAAHVVARLRQRGPEA